MLFAKASLLVGGPGTAKTTIIKAFLEKQASDTSVSKNILFSYLTTPEVFQRAVEVSKPS